MRVVFLQFLYCYFYREEYVLDEDDYELLEYNNVIPRRKVVQFFCFRSFFSLKFNSQLFY